MKPLPFARPGETLSVLCLGAHADDIEIGAGGLLMQWLKCGVRLEVLWCVLSAAGARAAEAEQSARALLAEACLKDVKLARFEDGFFPQQEATLKRWMEDLKAGPVPDVILTHRRDDAHQDHRAVSRLTWNTFRDHTILEYEIPKWDGDLGRPNLYAPFGEDILARKIELLLSHFATQRPKDWFDAETFRGLARLRGMECRSPGRYAEAFVLRKACLA
ncbi:PIG-L deacetylase family protein [Kaistia nematophila]|uniref:PIG-L family deacetylase n=1 Tax=Kaistia nematophila TaxID=2994654 RepID=A0A9X3DYX8_9HYPH|nr:PIG-L deacetylase family protein [Kaistia nematophila]MCX5568524.1 PIG-L family deacetylase [Kaistia nematophila]